MKADPLYKSRRTLRADVDRLTALFARHAEVGAWVIWAVNPRMMGAYQH